MVAERRPTYLSHMLVATTFVVVVPAAVVWLLRAANLIDALVPTIAIALALTVAASFAGAAYWKRRKSSVLFSELLLWGWLRRRRIERHLERATKVLEGGTADVQILAQIAAVLDAEDPYLAGHSRRVARYAAMTARKMHLSHDEITRIEAAAVMHDVGKLRISRGVLQKPGKLTDDEFIEMKCHAAEGARMIDDPELAAIVRHHHERFDGSGYPDGLKGDEIPLGARIIAVVDTFDAITSARPYHSATPHKKALDIIEAKAGSQFDPDAARAFIRCYRDRRTVALWISGGAAWFNRPSRGATTPEGIFTSLLASLVVAAFAGTVIPSTHHATPTLSAKGVMPGTGGNPGGGRQRGSLGRGR
jgi:HD-GYP domain-containing protein (c-di-GMP phosphodiesterase class II)